jgi:hypothetical protein
VRFFCSQLTCRPGRPADRPTGRAFPTGRSLGRGKTAQGQSLPANRELNILGPFHGVGGGKGDTGTKEEWRMERKDNGRQCGAREDAGMD